MIICTYAPRLNAVAWIECNQERINIQRLTAVDRGKMETLLQELN